MQARFDKAARLVTADIESTTVLGTIVTVRLDDRNLNQYRYGHEDGGLAHGLGPIEADTEQEATVVIAELAQDDVIQALWEPWPPCPGHGHPAQPVARSRLAVWVCPTSGAQLAQIGHLPRA
jgi:hypothetical protein